MNKEINDYIKECDKLGVDYVKYDFDFSEPKKNPEYIPEDIKDDIEWLMDLYQNCLNMNVDDQDSGLRYWMSEIRKGRDRNNIIRYFHKVAREDNAKLEAEKMTSHISQNKNKKILFVLRQSLGDAFISTALFKSIKGRYPEHDLYVATQVEYIEVFYCNPYVHEVIPYDESMENELLMVGFGAHKGMFDVYFNPAVSTQRQLNYISNDKIDLRLEESA